MTNIASKSSSPITGEAAISRTTVRIPTVSGDELEAWLYLPEGNGPHPVVVMAHGIGAIKAGGLAPF
jgi:dipeptidyl aminopeptidase/acylaminoacyl peptidase